MMCYLNEAVDICGATFSCLGFETWFFRLKFRKGNTQFLVRVQKKNCILPKKGQSTNVQPFLSTMMNLTSACFFLHVLKRNGEQFIWIIAMLQHCSEQMQCTAMWWQPLPEQNTLHPKHGPAVLAPVMGMAEFMPVSDLMPLASMMALAKQ